jgi:hypothetical protein
LSGSPPASKLAFGADLPSVARWCARRRKRRPKRHRKRRRKRSRRRPPSARLAGASLTAPGHTFVGLIAWNTRGLPASSHNQQLRQQLGRLRVLLGAERQQPGPQEREFGLAEHSAARWIRSPLHGPPISHAPRPSRSPRLHRPSLHPMRSQERLSNTVVAERTHPLERPLLASDRGQRRVRPASNPGALE